MLRVIKLSISFTLAPMIVYLSVGVKVFMMVFVTSAAPFSIFVLQAGDIDGRW